MDPDETQMFVEAYWWRWEMEDRMQAHYAAQQLMAAGAKKNEAKPKKIKFLSEWHYGDDAEQDKLEGSKKTSKSEKVVSIAEHKRAKSALAASRARVPWGSESG